MSRITMIAKKKTTAVIGASMSALLMAALMFLPVIPFTFAGSTQSANVCGAARWIPLSSALSFRLNNLSTSFSFELQANNSVYHDGYDRAGKYWHYLTYTNLTASFSAYGFAVAHGNGTVGRFAAAALVNGSLDSYLKFNGLFITTHNLNASAIRVTLDVAHVEALYGRYLATNNNSPMLPVGIPVSFDNFHMSWLYNCKSHGVSYSASGITNAASAIEFAISQRQTGALASLISGDSR